MRGDINVRNRDLNLRHVTTHTLASRAVRGMMGMSLQCCCTRSIGTSRLVAGLTDSSHRSAQLSRVVGTVYIVAAKTGDAVAIHHALNKVISLHTILVPRAIGEMSKTCFS